MFERSNKTFPSILLCFTVALALGCGEKITLDAPEVTPDTRISLVRQPDRSYLLKTNEGGVQPIYIGTRPTNIDWSTPYGQRQGRRTVITPPGLADRYFVGMLTDQGDTLIVSDQLIPLSGSNNFRDIGGIPTRDGRYVRWGQIYRSDRLSALTKGDLRYLESLGLQTVYDFRSESEVEEDPNILPSIDGLEYINEPIYFDVEDTTHIKERILSGEMSEIEAGDILVQGNRLFATDMSQRFKPFIDCLLEGKGPIVYHCTSGKDRTGFATLLLLSAVNVGRDTIVEDYLLSNYYRYKLNANRLRKLRYASIVKRNLNASTIAPLMVVDRRYINAAYDAIDEKYGSIDAFLEQEYGLTAEKRAELVDLYTYGPAVMIDGEFVPAEEGDLKVEKPVKVIKAATTKDGE